MGVQLHSNQHFMSSMPKRSFRKIVQICANNLFRRLILVGFAIKTHPRIANQVLIVDTEAPQLPQKLSAKRLGHSSPNAPATVRLPKDMQTESVALQKLQTTYLLMRCLDDLGAPKTIKTLVLDPPQKKMRLYLP